MPFVFDLMRAETFWQDRKQALNQTSDSYMYADGVCSSLVKKKLFGSRVKIFVSYLEKLFVFEFHHTKTKVEEPVKHTVYKITMPQLHMEDIINDFKDIIIDKLTSLFGNTDMRLDDSFINGLAQMVMVVRKVQPNNENRNEWSWHPCRDFDRLEKFSDDEVWDKEVCFKLVPKTVETKEVWDEKPKNLSDGYNCFALYRHSDLSFQWRLCKIVGKHVRKEFKGMAALDNYMGHTKKYLNDQLKQHESVHSSDQFTYTIEFEHL